MQLTRLTSLLAVTAVVAATLIADKAAAAIVLLQDYEAPGNLDAPFNLQPDFSGTTVGVNGATDNITHVPSDGAAGTAASAEVVIPHLASESPTAAGWQWQVRLLPNSGGSSSATNPVFTTDGYVGYWLKVDSSVAANMMTGPALDDLTTTVATLGDLTPVIKDGQWHLYQWNMDDATQFDNPWSTAYAGGLGDATLGASASFDSIAIVSPNGGNATLRIDQIGYDNAGPLPEPSTLALAGLGLLGVGLAACRRAA